MAPEPFDWIKYLNLAIELAQRPEQSCRRTALSRAYYFVYHLARNRIDANGFIMIPGGDSHKQVWEKFSGSPDPECKRISDIARRLKDRRLKADYEDHYPRLDTDVADMLIDAREFVDRLKRLPARLPVNTGARQVN